MNNLFLQVHTFIDAFFSWRPGVKGWIASMTLSAPHSQPWPKLATLSFTGQVQKQEISKSTSLPRQKDSARLHRSISFLTALVQED